MAGLDAIGEEGWGSGGGGVGEDSWGAVTKSSPLGVSWGNVGGGGGGRGSVDAVLASGCGVSIFVARAAMPAGFRAPAAGDALPPARAAAAAAAA